jgi:L-alanine-DL-glutamate epimerase-like enolase superfamily enzyme
VQADVAAGEYVWSLVDAQRLVTSDAVDCLQADATRCGGATGFLAVGALCLARGVELSAHTAPALHLPLCAATLPFRHLEWFHDHVRIERMLFDGAPEHDGGVLHPNRSDPGLGLELKRADAERFRVA